MSCPKGAVETQKQDIIMRWDPRFLRAACSEHCQATAVQLFLQNRSGRVSLPWLSEGHGTSCVTVGSGLTSGTGGRRDKPSL